MMTPVTAKGWSRRSRGHGMDEMRDAGPDRGPVGCSAQGGHSGQGLGRGRGVCHLTPEHSLCTHSPSVQFLESSSAPLQSRPPFWGGGAMHSRLRQCAHSVLQADHLLHSVHAPSTVGAQRVPLCMQTATQTQ